MSEGDRKKKEREGVFESTERTRRRGDRRRWEKEMM